MFRVPSIPSEPAKRETTSVEAASWDENFPFEMQWVVASHAAREVDIGKLRKEKKNGNDLPNLPLGLLRHADEQTVAGAVAVYQAIQSAGWEGRSFSRWGVIAAPCYLGRMALPQALERFRQEGAWGISPHLIPHRSLHSLSGTLSQALQIHGPNFGVGGGPTAVGEAFLLAASLLADDLPGLWVILTGYSPAGRLVDQDNCVHGSYSGNCRAVALALQQFRGADSDSFLTLKKAKNLRKYPLLTLDEIFLALQGNWIGQKSWSLPHGGTIELSRWHRQLEGRRAA